MPDDFGYFGRGLSGYIHYNLANERNNGGDGGGGGGGGGGCVVYLIILLFLFLLGAMLKCME